MCSPRKLPAGGQQQGLPSLTETGRVTSAPSSSDPFVFPGTVRRIEGSCFVGENQRPRAVFQTRGRAGKRTADDRRHAGNKVLQGIGSRGRRPQGPAPVGGDAAAGEVASQGLLVGDRARRVDAGGLPTPRCQTRSRENAAPTQRRGPHLGPSPLASPRGTRAFSPRCSHFSGSNNPGTIPLQRP